MNVQVMNQVAISIAVIAVVLLSYRETRRCEHSLY